MYWKWKRLRSVYLVYVIVSFLGIWMTVSFWSVYGYPKVKKDPLSKKERYRIIILDDENTLYKSFETNSTLLNTSSEPYHVYFDGSKYTDNVTKAIDISTLETKVRRSRLEGFAFLCPFISPLLQGAYRVERFPHDEDYMNYMHKIVKPGGHYKPSTCIARHRIAIIIPYRNRKLHLLVLLNNLHTILQRQQLDYGVFVVELEEGIDFNRALSMNIGFIEAIRSYDYQCFAFHDVDLVPENDTLTYACPDTPRHMSVAVSTFKYRLPYQEIFGGVSILTKQQFLRVNGFSNKFFVWGGEDDDMYKRIAARGMLITRFTEHVARYKMLPHQRTKPNLKRKKLLETGPDRWRSDGLNSLKYRAKVIKRKLYTYILVNINQGDPVYASYGLENVKVKEDEELIKKYGKENMH